MIQAIETRYKGYRFRSRLEARWAVFFDALGVEWQYEPQPFRLGDGTGYLPDFCLEGDTWVEVKPAINLISSPDWSKLNRFSQECHSLWLLDGPPSARMHAVLGNGHKEPWLFGVKVPAYERSGWHWCGKGRLWWESSWDNFVASSLEDARSVAIAAVEANDAFGYNRRPRKITRIEVEEQMRLNHLGARTWAAE